MAIKKKFDTAITVQLTQEWRDRIRAVADHERIEDSEASVIRDAIEFALPGWELELGITQADEDVSTAGYAGGQRLDEEDVARLTGKEDRSAGCFGGPPKPE